MINRKRVSDVDDEPRPPKRSRPDSGRSGDAKPRPPRDDVPRRKDRAPPAPTTSTKDAPLHRDEKPSTVLSSTLSNGKAALKAAAASSADAASPSAARPRGESVNGTKLPGTGGSRSLSTKHDSKLDPTLKSSLPPLLSPLNLSLPFEDADDHAVVKPERRRRDDARDRPRSPKHKKPDPAPTASKRQRSPPRIPPLLSPTLPPIVEAALELSKAIALDALDGKTRDSKDSKESFTKKKKTTATAATTAAAAAAATATATATATTKSKKTVSMDDMDDDEPPPTKSQRKTLIVTLKIPAGLRATLRRELNASSSGRREASQRDHERSATDDSSQHAQARKRPVLSSDAPSETVALKKPRAADALGHSRPSAHAPPPPAPSTPSKKGPTAMSRVSSNNSLAQTPGDAVHATPSTSAAVDRRVNGNQGGPGAEGGPAAKALRDKESKFHILGRKLKHDADVVLKTDRLHSGGSGSGGGGPTSGRDANPKLGYVLSLESLLAFMAGFHAQNLHRLMSNKKCDPIGWSTLFPFLEFVQEGIRRQEASRRFLPLYSLLLLLHAVAVDEVLKCYAALENPAAVKMEELLRLERTRSRIWPQIRDANELIEHRELRVDVHPWATLDEITVLSSRILKRWCAEEKVNWSMDPSLREPVEAKTSQS